MVTHAPQAQKDNVNYCAQLGLAKTRLPQQPWSSKGNCATRLKASHSLCVDECWLSYSTLEATAAVTFSFEILCEALNIWISVVLCVWID